VNRRTLLKALAACSGSLLLEACAAKRVHPTPNSASVGQLHLPKVLVSADREIPTTVCLRPFRAPGFRLAAEKLDDKLCVHNYGHGGAGITLSWGTAQLATEEVRKSGQKQVAVLGCGVVGLATARRSGAESRLAMEIMAPDSIAARTRSADIAFRVSRLGTRSTLASWHKPQFFL
jgi:D-amino-acid oxidase